MPSTTYIVRPNDQNVVVAQMNEIQSPIEEIRKRCSADTTNIVISVSDIYNVFHDADGKTIKAVAKCQPEDTFDELIGKKIASAKANTKYHSWMIKKLTAMSEKLLAAVDELQILMETHREAIAEMQTKYEGAIAEIQPFVANDMESAEEVETDTEEAGEEVAEESDEEMTEESIAENEEVAAESDEVGAETTEETTM